LVVGSCDTTTDQQTPGVIARSALGPAAENSPPTGCEISTQALIELARTYTADVRDVRQACSNGATCEQELATASTSLDALASGHSDLLAACGSPSVEICDGIDNDFDSAIDEDFPDLGSSCSAGVGICLRSGTKICSADHTGTICSVSPGVPGVEIPGNGLDDDCDGQIDEAGETS
jgi:hypothetical protein